MKIIARFLLILCLVVAAAACEVAHAQTPPPVQVLPDPPRGGDPIAPVAPGLQQPAPPPRSRPAPSPPPGARGASPALQDPCHAYRRDDRMYRRCLILFFGGRL